MYCSLSRRCSRQEDWSGLSFPSPGNLPDPETEPREAALAVRFFTTEPPAKPTLWSIDSSPCSLCFRHQACLLFPGFVQWMLLLGMLLPSRPLCSALLPEILSGSSQVAQWQRIHLQQGRCEFDPWIRKIPWRRKWQPTPVFLPGEFHGQRNLVGCSQWGHNRVKQNLVTKYPSIYLSSIYLF